jgi:hypothetical protein
MHILMPPRLLCTVHRCQAIKGEGGGGGWNGTQGGVKWLIEATEGGKGRMVSVLKALLEKIIAAV